MDGLQCIAVNFGSNKLLLIAPFAPKINVISMGGNGDSDSN